MDMEMDTSDPTPSWSPPAPNRFAVLDVETTGFNARGTDRIVEIAIVSMGHDRRGHRPSPTACIRKRFP